MTVFTEDDEVGAEFSKEFWSENYITLMTAIINSCMMIMVIMNYHELSLTMWPIY